MHFRGRPTWIWSLLELKRLWCTKAFLDDWPSRSPVKYKRFGSLICFLRRDWCGEWPEVASIEVRACVSPSLRCFYIIGTHSDRRVESYWAVITHFTFDALLLTVVYESPILCRLATVLLFFSTWPYWSLRPMCPRAVKVLTVLTLIQVGNVPCWNYSRVAVFIFCIAPLFSASTRRFQKIPTTLFWLRRICYTWLADGTLQTST